MRGTFALLVSFVVLTGCRTRTPAASEETSAHLPSRGFVTLDRLADSLDLYYVGEGGGGFIELSAPPDAVMLIRDSRRALVNGTVVSLADPCMRRGEQYVLSARDAERVTRTLARFRQGRAPRDPIPEIPPVRTAPERADALRHGWRPGAPARSWKYIVVHHTAAVKGSAIAIHRLHRSQNFDGLGYHFVIGNGTGTRDGQVEVGYRWRKQLVGAHARVHSGDDNRWNRFGIGVCLVGDFRNDAPSTKQMDALVDLVQQLCDEYGIPRDRVLAHRHVKPTLCPGPKFPWEEFHARLR